MTKMSTWGVIILPASPGFYHKPETIGELIDFVVARILDQLDIEHELSKRWTGEEVR
jgi:4-hydroxy-3-polyprenylbenzoate decarboxylase